MTMESDQENFREKLKSLNSEVPVNVVFQNKTQRFVDLFWIDFRGTLVRYKARLKENQQYAINTFETHPWIARDSETSAPLHIHNDFIYIPQVNYEVDVQRINISLPVYRLVDRCLDVLRRDGAHNVADSLEIPVSLQTELKKSRQVMYREYQPPRNR